jgi:hypothetical protein
MKYFALWKYITSAPKSGLGAASSRQLAVLLNLQGKASIISLEYPKLAKQVLISSSLLYVASVCPTSYKPQDT